MIAAPASRRSLAFTAGDARLVFCDAATGRDDFGIHSQGNFAIPIDRYVDDCVDFEPDGFDNGFNDTQGPRAISLSSTFFELRRLRER